MCEKTVSFPGLLFVRGWESEGAPAAEDSVSLCVLAFSSSAHVYRPEISLHFLLTGAIQAIVFETLAS